MTKEITHSRDGMVTKEKDPVKPKKLKKQDLIIVKEVTGPVPKITSSPDQGRLSTP